MIKTKRLVLKEPSVLDAIDLLNIRNSEYVLKYNGLSKVTLTDYQREIMSKPAVLFYHIFLNGYPIGEIMAHRDSLRYGANSVELGYWLDEKYSSQGYMSEALQGVLAYMFRGNVERVTVRVFEPNGASRRMIEKNGFVLEGILHDAVRGYGGILYNDCLYSLSRKDYLRGQNNEQ